MIGWMQRVSENAAKAKDSGWAWVVCLMCTLLMFFVNGFSLTIGLLYAYLLEEFGESRANTALVASILHSTTFLSSPICCVIIKRIGFRKSMFLTGFILSLAFLGSSIVEKLEVLYVTLSFAYGFGACLVINLVFCVLFQYFEQKASLANGIVAAGVPLGPIIFTKPFKLLLESYGWRFLLRVLAIPLFVIIILGAIVLIPKKENCSCPAQRNTLKLCISLMKQSYFLIWLIGIFLARLGADIMAVHQTQFCIEFGIPWEKASMLPLYMGIGNAIGRLALGQFFHIKVLHPITIYQIIMVLGGVTGLVSSLSTTYAHIVAFSILYMTFDGSIQGLDAVPVMSISGRSAFPEAFGIQLMIQGISRLIGPPALGLMVDKLGDYSLLFYCVGLPLILGALALCGLRCIKSGPFGTENNSILESKIDDGELYSVCEKQNFLTERLTSV